MTAETQLPALGPAGPTAGCAGAAGALERPNQVTLQLTLEVGRTRMTLGQALALAQGSVITLDRLADQPVDLLVNGRSVARGEVVVIDDVFGLRVTQIVASADDAATEAAELAAVPAQPQLAA